MNITYWLVISALLVIAFLIILPPLWRRRTIEAANAEQRNVKIARDRARDLKQQLQAGALTQQQFDEQHQDLELTLADDLDAEHSGDKNWTQGRWAVPVIVIAVPLVSILIYLQFGELDALKKAQQPPKQAAGKSELDVNAMVAGLARRLNENPDNPQGWLMLGRSYKHLQQFRLAVNAYENAYALLGDQPEVMLHYADALAMANGGKLAGKASELVFKALAKEPNNVMGLWLGGMAKAELGESKAAMQIFRKLETIVPADSEASRQLQTLMVAVQAQDPSLKIPVKSVSKAAVTAVSINVQVSVADAIKAKVKQNDTVFIYAKALTGPPMPLAIVRKTVADLPLSVTLNDSMAMMPSMKLSNFQQVTVMARISKSGTAMQQKGDFIGMVKSQELAGSTAAEVVINEEIK